MGRPHSLLLGIGLWLDGEGKLKSNRMLDAYKDEDAMKKIYDVLLKEAIARGREDYFDPFGSLFEVYWRAGQRDSALQVLDQWLIRHPGDQEVLAVRERAALGGPPPGEGPGGS